MTFNSFIIYFVWTAVSAFAIGRCIENIKTNHPYLAGMDVGILIYALIRCFYPLFLLY